MGENSPRGGPVLIMKNLLIGLFSLRYDFQFLETGQHVGLQSYLADGGGQSIKMPVVWLGKLGSVRFEIFRLLRKL